MINLCFVGDPYRPTSQAEWESAWACTKRDLGLAAEISYAVDICVPAFSEPLPPADATSSFVAWSQRWLRLTRLDDVPSSDRIERVLRLWDEPVPGKWERSIDLQLLDVRYRRGDVEAPRAGEHTIEHEILHLHFDHVRYEEGRLVDGVNAMPFVRDEHGGRRGNVEADMLLLTKTEEAYGLVVCEVKHSADDPWCAAVENLRQLKLLRHSPAARAVFHQRNPALELPYELPIAGVVVAPGAYYSRPGRNANATASATRLLQTFTGRTGIAARLAVWNPASRRIEILR